MFTVLEPLELVHLLVLGVDPRVVARSASPAIASSSRTAPCSSCASPRRPRAGRLRLERGRRGGDEGEALEARDARIIGEIGFEVHRAGRPGSATRSAKRGRPQAHLARIIAPLSPRLAASARSRRRCLRRGLRQPSSIMKRKSPSSGAGSSSSRHTRRPVPASIPIVLNEHLDRCLASSRRSAATPLPPPPQPIASRQPTVSPRTTPPALPTRRSRAPKRRRWPARADAAVDSSHRLRRRRTRPALLLPPGYASRLPADAFGGGRPLRRRRNADARRVSGWPRGAQPHSPTTAGDALAAVVRATADAAPPALAATAAITGALDALPPRGRALVALAFRGAGAWCASARCRPARQRRTTRRRTRRRRAAAATRRSPVARGARAGARGGLLEELTSESLRQRGGVAWCARRWPPAPARAPPAARRTACRCRARRRPPARGAGAGRGPRRVARRRAPEAAAARRRAALRGARPRRASRPPSWPRSATARSSRSAAAATTRARRRRCFAARATSARARRRRRTPIRWARRRRSARRRPPPRSSAAPRRRWPTATAPRRSARCATPSRCSATAAPSTRRSWRPPSPPRSRAWRRRRGCGAERHARRRRRCARRWRRRHRCVARRGVGAKLKEVHATGSKVAALELCEAAHSTAGCRAAATSCASARRRCSRWPTVVKLAVPPRR